MFAFVLVAPFVCMASSHDPLHQIAVPQPDSVPVPFSVRLQIHRRLREYLTEKKNPCGGDNAMQCNGQPLK